MNARDVASGAGTVTTDRTVTSGVCRVEYTGSIDGLTVIIDDASSIDIFELLDDFEVLFDATEAGRLVGLTVRGARLGRPGAWTRAVATVLGPSLWDAYQRLERKARSQLVGDEGDDEVSEELVLLPDEWAWLRDRVWLALHASLRQSEWWQDERELNEPPEIPSTGVDEPWVLVVSLPPRGTPANLHLPAPLALACGVERIGYVSRTQLGSKFAST